MIIERMDAASGIVRVRPETLDDLWHIQKVLEQGDLLTARTLRKLVIKRGSEIKDGDRVPVTLTISLEKSELSPGTHALRLTGPVTSGPEDKVRLGSYHTISLEVRDSVTISKQAWKPWQLDRLRSARAMKPLLFICAIDREEASFAELRESGIVHTAEIGAKKSLDDSHREDYYREVMEYLASKTGYQAVVIAGPGFERENLMKFSRERGPRLSLPVILEHTSTAGRAGITEMVRSAGSRILMETRVARESQLVEALLAEISKSGLAAYGSREVSEALDMGAVETLLVSEARVRELEPLLERTEKQAGRVAIISGDHDAGERLLHLGGIAALLRFRF